MVPGVLLAILLMIYVAFISHKRNYPAGVVMSKREFLKATVQALPALFTVVILLGGIYSGICTPTEAGAVASAYALIISALIYKTLGWKKLWGIIKKSAANTATPVSYTHLDVYKRQGTGRRRDYITSYRTGALCRSL